MNTTLPIDKENANDFNVKSAPKRFKFDGVDDLTTAMQHVEIEDEQMKKEFKESISEMDQMFEEHARKKLKNTTKAKLPKEMQGITMFDHQKQGFQWMVQQERAESPPAFWTNDFGDGSRWRCKVHGFKFHPSIPEPIRGGILADDMGLGKTIQTIATMCTNRPDEGDPPCTLIVAPKSVMMSWKSHFQKYVKKNTFKNIKVHDDDNYEKLVGDIKKKKFDVVIISYSRLVVICEKHPNLIESTSFFRVILDEAHLVRNRATKSFKAVKMVQAKHRWALTGSPFVNSPDDIASLLSFLKVDPLADKNVFKEKVTDPIRKLRMIGLSRLRTILSHVILRRTKMHIRSEIPSKTVEVVKVDYSSCSVHQHLLKELNTQARDAVVTNVEAPVGQKEKVLPYVNRVRQASLDARLLPDEYKCGMLVPQGPKIDSVIDLLGKMGADEKAVIFSEWTSCLDLMEEALDERGFEYGRIDGTMPMHARETTIAEFQEEDSDGEMQGPRVMLVSSKAGGVGITLTRANVVFLTSPWWNAAEEAQAMDRVHRIGQKREVRVYRMVVEDSIEERMAELQESKAALGKGTFTNKLTKREMKKAKLTAIKDLFGISHSANWDMMDDFLNDDDDSADSEF